MRRLPLPLALALSILGLAAGPATAAVSQGGPWAPDILDVAAIDATTWLASTDRGLFRSTDAGVTWSAVTSFPAAAGASAAPSGFEPAVVAAAGQRVYAISGDRTVASSSDGGQTWSFADQAGDWGLISLAVDPGNAQRLILTTNDSGVQVSADAGTTWTRASVTAGGSTDDNIGNVQFLGDGSAIAIRAGGNGGTYIASGDGGLTWPTTRTISASGFALRGLVGTGGASLVAVGANGSSCAPWQAPESGGLTLSPSQLQVMTSADAGATWTSRGTICSTGSLSGGGQWLGLVGAGDRVAFISGSSTASVSNDGGITFTDVAKPAYLQQIGGFAAAGGDLVIAGNTGVMLVTATAIVPRTVGVESYTGVAGLASAPGTPSTVLVSLGERGLFRSTNTGATWETAAPAVAAQAHLTSVIQPPAFADGTTVAFPIDAPGTTSSTPGLRIFSSVDAGATWSLARVVDGYEPGGAIEFAAGDAAYLPIHLPYTNIAADPSRCAIGAANRSFTTFAVRPIQIGGVEPECTRMNAIASDPENAQIIVAIGESIDANGVMTARRFYRSADGGTSWTLPTGLESAFPTAMWAPTMHVEFAAGRVHIWQARSSTLCTSTDAGVTFACSTGGFATTPGGPGWFAGGYLSSFEPQADGSIVASVVDPADWTDRNDALPDANVATFLARSIDRGATWAVADPVESAAVTDVVDVVAQASGRARRSALGTRRLVIASAGVFRRTVAFKRAAKGRATPSLAGIVVRKSGRATVRVTCPRKARCTGFVTLASTATGRRFTSNRTPFDLSRSGLVVLRIPKASLARVAAGSQVPVRLTIQRTVGGKATYRSTAKVQR